MLFLASCLRPEEYGYRRFYGYDNGDAFRSFAKSLRLVSSASQEPAGKRKIKTARGSLWYAETRAQGLGADELDRGRCRMSDEGDKAYSTVVALNNQFLGKGSLEAEIANNNALGNITLKDDLGTYGEIGNLVFAHALDEQTRDLLISHTREDVASTFAHALSAFKAAHEAKEIAKRTRRLSRWILFVVIILALQGFLILGAVM